LSLLIAEPPLQVLRTLAVRVGLGEAIVLQQLHYYGRRREGGWVRRGYSEWLEDFPFWSEVTVRRIFGNLQTQKVVEKRVVPIADGRACEWRVAYESGLGGLLNLSRGSDHIDQTPVTLKGREKKERTPKKVLSPDQEPIGFSEWLTYHAEKSGGSVPRAGTTYRSDLARVFASLLGEGYELEDFRLATDGVLGTDYMVTGQHTKPSNVLRKTKFEEWVDRGREARSRPMSEAERVAAKYAHLDA
jgi:hypothetical protein